MQILFAVSNSGDLIWEPHLGIVGVSTSFWTHIQQEGQFHDLQKTEVFKCPGKWAGIQCLFQLWVLVQ